MKSTLFYFDYLSPFSYFAWRELSGIPTQIIFKPTPLGPLLNHWGIKGPGEVQPKREFLLKQCLRFSKTHGIPFTTPKTHPFNSLYALRLSTLAASGAEQARVIAALWNAGWVERIDMGEPEELIAALNRAGLAGQEIFEKSFNAEAKKEVKANIADATGQGVFGVPSFVHEGELFWGHDSLTQLKQFLRGEDNLDHEKLKMLLLSTPRAAQQSI
jgi:2-hydroxychromene-2-carboxylate isomerase